MRVGTELCKCGSPAVRWRHKQGLCFKHYRVLWMRISAKRAGKVVPSQAELEALFDRQCPDCNRPFNFLIGEGDFSLTPSLQHYRDGSFGVVCVSCNCRHASMPLDTYREMPKDHKFCPKCSSTKPLSMFSKDNSRTGPLKVKSWCQVCSRSSWKAWNTQRESAQS